MSDANPYAPPQAAVADVHEWGGEVQPARFWSAGGRIGRLRFLAWLTGAYLLLAVVAVIAAALVGATAGGTATLVLMGVLLVAWIAFGLFTAIQRSHDMGWSGWTILLMLIPLVSLIWVFKPGTPGANRFGAPPPPNGTGVKILAFLFPVLLVLGTIAPLALPGR